MRNYLPVVAILCLLITPTAIRAEEQNRKTNFNLSCGLLGKFVRYQQHYQHCKPEVICNDRGVCRKKPTKSVVAPSVVAPSVVAPEVTQENPETNAIADADPSLTVSAGITADADIAGASADGSAGADASAGPGGADASGSAEGGANAGGASVGGGIGGGLGVGGL
jgi:hypothetical protein